MGSEMRGIRIFFILFTALVLPCGLAAQSLGGGGGSARGGLDAAAWYEKGQNAMSLDDWYSATEAYLECLALNPSHAQATAALAECYYELGEFDEALTWVRKARVLARSSTSAANLEALTLIALGKLDDAARIVSGILAQEPYNREALFTAGELDIARGRSADALLRYRDAVSRYPDDRRLLISIALVAGSLGDKEMALSYINRALSQHPEDFRVFYYAAWINAQNGQLSPAIRYATQALVLRPGYSPARSLLANLRYLAGNYEEAARLADEAIAARRDDSIAWYLKGLSYIRLGRQAEAITVLGNAVAINPDDEFIRAALENTIIAATGLEDPQRGRWASWHFDRARDFRSRSLIDQAVFEYRRGLRLNPYAQDRREYAELLRLQGYPARYLEELRFMQDNGMGDRSLDDAVEAYNSLLSGALFRLWGVNPVDLTERHWKIAVFSLADQASFNHVDSGAVAAGLVKELLIHDRNIAAMDMELRQPSFSQCFRLAREQGADYFMIISVQESERDISIKADLYTGRTGSSAGTYYTYRTGLDRLRNASRGIIEQFSSALPLRAKLVMRKQNQGLIDKGRADGVKEGQVFDIVKKGQPQIKSDGIGLAYTNDDITGKLQIDSADEEVAAGTMTRNGFFDRIEPGDEIILQAAQGSSTPRETAVNPELRSLLRTLR
ncbi:MAG: tetratricopeptide repeat protein [Treponema sp.]|nr:tetratricopeptide repeat protein [Treponema sp.]